MNSRFIIRIVCGCLLFLVSLPSHAQSRKRECETCFNSEITKAVKNGEHCTDYEITVSYSGKCDHALSHFTIAVPHCATVKNLLNSHRCSQSTGYDATTGLTGIVMDNISNFGQSAVKTFVVSFTLCSNASCDALKCWKPIVAYKAGTCFELDTLKASCPSLKVHLEKQNASCFGVADGRLTTVVDEGKAPYTYVWSNGATTATITNIGAGPYSVTVTDASAAHATATETITQPAAVAITSAATNATCDGQGDGTISLTVTGGSGGPYAFLWNNGATTKDLINLKAGIYSVTAKDSSGCIAQASVTITNTKQLVLTANTLSPACNQSNGSVSVTASGGSEPYSYLWSTGATTSSVGNIPAGSYTVTVTDAGGCSIKGSYFLRENNTLRISFSVTPTSCLDDSSGAINLTPSGGTPPYSYSWSNGPTTEDISGLKADFYTVTITDSLGCKLTTRISVPKNTFQVSSQITQPKCFGDATGAITATPSGGVEPYTFSWSTGATTAAVTALPKGTYSVTITDATGCSRISTYVISGPGELKATAVVTAPACTQFSIDLTVSGGTQPYQYLWSTGDQTQDLTGLNSGTYTVTVTDVNGCHFEKAVSIDSIASWTCAIQPPVLPPVCLSANNMIMTSIGDATSYSWSISSSDSSWVIQSGTANDTLIYTAGKENSSATFTLTLSKNGCSQSCSYTVSACTTSGPPTECEDCFHSRITLKGRENSCSTYMVKVSTEGYCDHDLANFAISIPCGTLSHYANSESWPMVVGNDSISGLTSLSVGQITDFGDRRDSFTLTFTVCSSGCGDSLRHWEPVVRYNTGQCVTYDTLRVQSGSFSCSAYPNPFRNSCQFEFDCDDDDHVTIEICDQFGKKVCEDFECDVASGERKTINFDAAHLRDNLYIYKIRSRNKTTYGKLFKAN